MPASTACKIRSMTRAELDIAVKWAAAEGWNPGKADAEAFWQADPAGYFVLELEGEMIGSGSAVSYDGQYGFMGFFIVKPEHRGKGMGGKLWLTMRDTLRQRLEPDTAIGIDGVFAMQDAYGRTGFVFSHRNLRMEGIASKLAFDGESFGPLYKAGGAAVSAAEHTADVLAELIEADKQWFGCSRPRFLAKWLDPAVSRTIVYRKDGKIAGYGTVRQCLKGYKIGPLFAPDAAVAEDLYRALTAPLAGEVIYLDVPDVNTAAMELASRHGLKESFGCARMYIGTPPAVNINQVFGITTFELG